MRLTTQRGYLLLVCIVLIVIIAFIGLAVTYIISGSAISTNAFSEGEKAFYVAEAGLEKANRFLLTPTTSGANARISCANLNSNANLTSVGFDTGTFTVTKTASSPFDTGSTLSGAITSSATSLTVASSAGFAPAGRLIIDREAINYSTLSGTTFSGLTRGVNGTTASSHAIGAGISQYQCVLDSQGGIPNLTSPLFKRELQQGLQLQNGWTVGVNTGSAFNLIEWNDPTELQWNTALLASATDRPLAAISLLSNADGWAVGTANGTNLTFLRLTASGWQTAFVSGGCSNQVLNGVSAVSSQEAWAVGERSTCHSAARRYEIIRWNGSTWTELTPPTIPPDNSANQHLNAVSVIDTNGDGLGNIGFAVGDNGVILQYNGSTWTAATSPTTRDLNAVFVVSATQAWAVGNNGTIISWNGSTWSTVTSPTTTQLNSIYMLDPNNTGSATGGWAIGNSGVAIRYNGSSWSSQNAGGGNLFGVAAFADNDAWAVGANGRIIHWDGSSWTAFTSGVTQQLNGIDIIPPKNYPYSGWSEVYS